MSRSAAFDHIQEILWHFASHRVLTVAARTGILKGLSTTEVEPETLAASLSLDPLATGKMVRALCAMKIAAHGDGGYVLRPGYAELFSPEGVDHLPFILHSHELYDRWGTTLEPWVRGEAVPFTPRSAEQIALFGQAMRSIASETAMRVAEKVDISACRQMLDLGGGTGTWAEILCDRNPALFAEVLDLPEVADAGTARLASMPLSKRICFTGGHYLNTPLERKYDLVLLANVIHQETKDGAAKMIRRAADALLAEGKILIVEFSIDDAKEDNLMGALFAINMRSFGDTHSEADIRGWLCDAGLQSIERIDIDPNRWVFAAGR